MVRVNVIIREQNRLKPDYSLEFDLPEVPRVGDYISIFRPDSPAHAEDVVVRHIWWHLHSPETRTMASNPQKVGTVQDIMVECDIALGPFASRSWRLLAQGAKERGAEVVEFQVDRIAIPEK